MVFYDQSKEGLAMQESRLFKIVYHLLDKGRATAPELADKRSEEHTSELQSH